jgi:hypothetical protein
MFEVAAPELVAYGVLPVGWQECAEKAGEIFLGGRDGNGHSLFTPLLLFPRDVSIGHLRGGLHRIAAAGETISYIAILDFG